MPASTTARRPGNAPSQAASIAPPRARSFPGSRPVSRDALAVGLLPVPQGGPVAGARPVEIIGMGKLPPAAVHGPRGTPPPSRRSPR